MDPMEAFDVIMEYVKATRDVKDPAPLYRALLRAADEMVANSGQRDPEDQISYMREEDVALLRERMSDLGM